MKQVLLIVTGAIASVVVLFVVVGLMLPNHWNVERSILIHAPASKIHPLVEDLHAWGNWVESRDPTLRYEFTGPERGVGANRIYHSQYAGTGSTQITLSDPSRGIEFESCVNSPSPTAHGKLTYASEGPATRVTWHDEGKLPVITGAYLRDSVEEGLQRHMDESLVKLKDLAEHP
ncbi:MAG TPA: SRPBCC family protein [Polyangiaceae bacterium]|jgi:hypothetical protein|nr:SRPBCC family protein [Polyangiaceae bacterium]